MNQRKVIDYRILKDKDRFSLVKEIMTFLSDGWQPFGSLAITLDGDYLFYVQAMVKYE